MEEVFIAHSASKGCNWVIAPSDDDILHHGRKDQKWGVRNGPPYPLQMAKTAYKAAQKAASATGKATVKVAKGTAAAAKAIKRTTTKIATNVKEKKNVRDEKKAQKKKNTAVSHNSYKELYDIKDKLSYKDLSDAISRIELEQKIYSRAYPPQPTFSDKLYKISNKLGSANNFYKTGKQAWNNLAELYNSISDSVKIPTIGGKNSKGDKKDKKGEGGGNDNGGKKKDKEPNIVYNNVNPTFYQFSDNKNNSNKNAGSSGSSDNQNSNGLPGPRKKKNKNKKKNK